MADFAKALRYLQAPATQRHLFQPTAAAFSLAKQLEFLKARSDRTPVRESLRTEVLPGGETEHTPLGRHTVLRTAYAGDYHHGKCRLERFSVEDFKELATVMLHKGLIPERESIVFLDTETTGVHGGAGMCPFLVGLGYFNGDDFEVKQYFIRDFDEEPSMLFELSKLAERFRMVVTYNGGAFDLPLLEARFTLSRLESPFSQMSHFDMLHIARRLWRAGHGSCRLVALEQEILSFFRGPDVPGAMIPRAYFDFLQRGFSPTLTLVFKHNIHDVVSLAGLTLAACDRISMEPAPFDDPLDLYSLARVLENSAEWKRCVGLYETALAGGLENPVRLKAIENLVVIYRRLGEHERALGACRQLMDDEAFSLVGYEGAAIYFERIAGDHASAMDIVELALARIQRDGVSQNWKRLLDRRWERLRQKALRFEISI